MMLRCAAELGFTPVARMRVKADGDSGEKNRFEKFTGMRKGSGIN